MGFVFFAKENARFLGKRSNRKAKKKHTPWSVLLISVAHCDVAERVGFEPTGPAKAQRISRTKSGCRTSPRARLSLPDL